MWALPTPSGSSSPWAPAATTIEETINYLNKQGREGRPDQGSPVPSLLREALHGRHPRYLQEDRRAGPHQGARLSGRASVRWMCAPRWWRPAARTSRSWAAATAWAPRSSTPPWSRLCMTTCPRRDEEPLHRGHQRRRDRHLPEAGRADRSPLPKAPCPASSTAWAPTVPLAPTRTPSRSSATTPICTRRRYFSLRLQEVRRHHRQPPALRQDAHPVHLPDRRRGLRGLPQPQLRHQVRHGLLSEGRRRVPAEQPLDGRGAG